MTLFSTETDGCQPLSRSQSAQRRYTAALVSAFPALLLLLGCPWLCQGADHLPNAAAKIGTVVINNDAQFTTHLEVTLTIKGVNNGTGLSAMQFSNDGETWSAPEPYRTSKSWTLADDGLYPVGMNTVLRTVYVRFRDGAGRWSKAVTDSIVFAKSASDVPQIKEVWIMQQKPADYSSSEPPGSRRNPFLVPAGRNEVEFDSLMYSLMTNYGTYWPRAAATVPQSTATVLTIHLGPGVYETHGDNKAYGNTLAWSPRSGWRILGSGKDVTTLKMVDLGRNYWWWVDVIGGYYGDVAIYEDLEIADLTVDCNLQEGGSNIPGRFCRGLFFSGNNLQVRRVKVKNFGSHIPNAEPFAIGIVNFGSATGNANVILEDCDIVQPQVGNDYSAVMLHLGGTFGTDGQMRYYTNLIVRNCYLNGASYDGETPVDPALYPWNERGSHGLGIIGTWGALAEDNLVVNVQHGYYADISSAHDVTVRNNHFRSVIFGASMIMGRTSRETRLLEGFLRFDNNLVELDPRFFPKGDSWGTFGWRFGFRFTSDLKGPYDYAYHQLLIRSNVFQFNDRVKPDTNVGGTVGSLQGFLSAELADNAFVGMNPPISWDNSPEYLDCQADILRSNRTAPLIRRDNRTEQKVIVEEYPFLLDAALPRPVITHGTLLALPLPLIDGAPATTIMGLPPAATLEPAGLVRWKTTARDIGKYVLSFYDSPQRTNDPRRTLVSVTSRLSPDDPRYFSNNLLAFWRFDETSGTMLLDSSGNEITMNASVGISSNLLSLGAAGYAPGRTALRFLGSPGNHPPPLSVLSTNPPLFRGYTLPFHPLLNTEASLYQAFTIACWFNLEAPPRTNQLLLTDNSRFFWWLNPGSGSDSNRAALAFVSYPTNIRLSSPTNLVAGTWYHAAVVYDGIALRMFLDGALAAQIPSGPLTAYVPSSTFFVGGRYGADDFVGCLSELAVWGRPLADAEIARLRTDALSGVIPRFEPVPPSALRVEAVTDNTLRISWQDNSLNETAFVLERGVTPEQFTVVATLGRDATGFTDTIPQGGGTYYYRVKAVNRLGESDYSHPFAISDGKPRAPATLRFH